MSNIASQSAASGFGIHAITGVVAHRAHAGACAPGPPSPINAAAQQHVAASTPSAPWYAGVARAYIIGMLVGIPAIHLQAVCAIGTSVIGGMLVATLSRRCSCPSSSAGS